jgi:hypothetical protein
MTRTPDDKLDVRQSVTSSSREQANVLPVEIVEQSTKDRQAGTREGGF